MKTRYILIGAMLCAAIKSLYQDIVYKTAEGMAEVVLKSWTDRAITIPLAVLMLIVCGVIIFLDKRLESKDEEDKDTSND
jgi:hypothetical protein